jgi:hypothetical protein
MGEVVFGDRVGRRGLGTVSGRSAAFDMQHRSTLSSLRRRSLVGKDWRRIQHIPACDDHFWHLMDVPTAPVNVCFWHIADNPVASAFVRFWTRADKSGSWSIDGLSAYDPKRSLGREVLAGFEIKKTAPVRARVCAVVVEDSHRRKEQSATLCTTVSNYFAESRTNKFPFMGWRPLYASETTVRLRSNRATGSA